MKRRRISMIGAGLLVALLAACTDQIAGTASRGVGDFPSAKATSTRSGASAAPRSTPRSSRTTSAPSSSTSSRTGAAPTSSGPSDDASALLLVAADLPTGWRDNTGSGSGDDGDGDGDGADCLSDVTIGDLVDENDAADFVRGDQDTGVNLSESVGIAATPDDAKSVLAGALLDFDDCKTITFTSDGDTVTGSMTRATLANHGDESHSYRIELEYSGVQAAFYFEVIRKANILASVVIGGFTPSTVAEANAIAAKAYFKLG